MFRIRAPTVILAKDSVTIDWTLRTHLTTWQLRFLEPDMSGYWIISVLTSSEILCDDVSLRFQILTDLSKAAVRRMSLARGWNLTSWTFSRWAEMISSGSLMGSTRPPDGICLLRLYKSLIGTFYKFVGFKSLFLLVLFHFTMNIWVSLLICVAIYRQSSVKKSTRKYSK